MIKLVAAVSIGLILTGCASTRVEERREASTGMSDKTPSYCWAAPATVIGKLKRVLQIALPQLWLRANVRSD